jgi:PhnB protein
MTTINAYLNFNGKCREAMTFYKECIGGELTLMPVEGSPAEAQCPPAMKHHIMHSSLVKDGMVVMATDMSPQEGYVVGNNFALSVNCSSEEELNRFFSKLSEGGKVIDPVKKQFWGALFGVLIDKYSICWMFNYDMNEHK